MSKQPITYRLTPIDLAGHRFQVEVTVAEPNPKGQVVSLPAWIPGSYLMREFARQIESIEAHSKGKPFAIQKLDRNTWQVAPCAGPLTITTIVYAWDLSVRGAHLDETHGFVNGTSVFLQIHGKEQEECLLELVPPPSGQTAGGAAWKVYTSMPEATGHPQAAERHGFGWYRAPDYDALIDHPIEMGTPQVITFEAHGAPHEMVFTGVAPGLDLERIASDVKQICEAQIAFFEPNTLSAPFLDSASRYVFMTMITGDGYGGLEHRSSTALMTSRNDLPVRGKPEQTDGYRSFLGLVSHEYFHTWNVKRIKPAVFAPYDLSRENHTRLLWVFEGFTSYYDDLMLFRSGVIGLDDYLRLVARNITTVLRGPGRKKQSVAESSFDAWTRFYRQDENSPNALVSYYTKGALVALGLDITIRNETGGSYSLDDVMRLMWRRYGRDFYTGNAVGIAEDEMPDLIQEATGVDVREYLDKFVDGCEDLPFDALFASQGYKVEWKPESELPSMDVRTRVQGNDVVLATVYEDGAAHRAGLSAHDTLVAIDGLRVNHQTALDNLLSRYQPGDTVQVHVFRRDELRKFTLTLNPPPAIACVITREQTGVDGVAAATRMDTEPTSATAPETREASASELEPGNKEPDVAPDRPDEPSTGTQGTDRADTDRDTQTTTSQTNAHVSRGAAA